MSDKVNLIIGYEARNYITYPDMHVYIKGREFTVEIHKTITITMDKGEYDILIKSSIRSKKYHLVMDGNKQLQLGWNRLWGTITVKEIVSHFEI